jgi:hypothetical protein
MDPDLDLDPASQKMRAPANPNPDPQRWTNSKFFFENKYVSVTSFDFHEEAKENIK